MSQSWLAAMGIDVLQPRGKETRCLLGHRLLLIVSQGPKSMRELYDATGRVVSAADLHTALAELSASGLIAQYILPSRRHSGRPREVWSLLRSEPSAILAAQEAVAAAKAAITRRRRLKVWEPPTIADLRRVGLMPPEGGRRRSRRRKPVPDGTADAICDWIASGRYLRDYCRQPETPATRTVYAWAAKDPDFRRKFRHARELGELWIRDGYLELIDSPAALAMYGGGRKARRDFNRRYVRPIDLRLQRWRRHPRKAGRASGCT